MGVPIKKLLNIEEKYGRLIATKQVKGFGIIVY